MNVFILSTGRCGSTTFIRACEHIDNFTAGHEMRSHHLGLERLDYPDRHIEADSRLCWFLGRLDERFGDGACYVHLTRPPAEIARSYSRRFNTGGGIADAYRDAILMNYWRPPLHDPVETMRDYAETVNANIRLFLKGKSKVMHFAMDDWQNAFPQFWRWIGAEGDLDAAMAEWTVRHNAGPPRSAGRLARTKRRILAALRNL